MVKIKVENVSKTYRWGEEDIHVLKNVSLDIHDKEFTAIVGESGSGKTTLLNLMGGLDMPDSGMISIDEKSLSSFTHPEIAAFRGSNLGFIFQLYNLLQDFTVIENVMLPHYILSKNKKESLNKAKELLVKLGLSNRLDYYPSRLSGGEQQRVAIARALINQPEIILGDEPTGNLDKDNRERVLEILLNLKQEYGFTMVIVTHDLKIAEIADRSVRLNYGTLENS
ncbi:MAG: hypothetical protein A2Y41_13975 [Spirochaetes bacterium GWB1_36_13]|nr:MAG: hypothetical protein A2Y41_13975 [Spirochaetes bacterium GWB1_36_13]